MGWSPPTFDKTNLPDLIQQLSPACKTVVLSAMSSPGFVPRMLSFQAKTYTHQTNWRPGHGGEFSALPRLLAGFEKEGKGREARAANKMGGEGRGRQE